MDYFRLEQDHRIPNTVLMKNMMELPNLSSILQGDLTCLQRMTVMFVPSSTYNCYPNLLDRQLFMVKENIKSVFSLFCPDLVWRPICLIDQENRRHEFYQIPMLECIDCMDKQVILQDRIANREIFRVAKAVPNTVVISLAVAESLLRRKIDGIRLLPVKVV